VYVKYSID